MQHIETMTGNGTVTSDTGERVAVKYDINVYQDEIPAGNMLNPHATVPGMKEFHGNVWPVCFFGKTVLLEMQDGRKMRFFFTNVRGSIALSQWIG
jgi:hypothetical protein